VLGSTQQAANAVFRGLKIYTSYIPRRPRRRGGQHHSPKSPFTASLVVIDNADGGAGDRERPDLREMQFDHRRSRKSTARRSRSSPWRSH
jgi:hypothetical protein